MRPRIEAVVFDVGGVLAGQDLASADAAYGRLTPGLTAARVNCARDEQALYRLWELYSVGRLPAADYWLPVAEAVGVPGARWPALARAHGQTVWAVRDDCVYDLAVALRRQGEVRLGVLSNSGPEYEVHIPAVSAPFEVLHFSHRTGRRKPDAEAFFGVVGALGAETQETVFVDDKSRNVDAARQLGIAGICFTAAADLTARLGELGVRWGAAG